MKVIFENNRNYLENQHGNRLEFHESLIGLSWEYTAKEHDAFLENLEPIENALLYRNDIAYFDDKLSRCISVLLIMCPPEPFNPEDYDDDGDYYGDENLDTFKTFD